MSTQAAPPPTPQAENQKPPSHGWFLLISGLLVALVVSVLFLRPWGSESLFNDQGNAASVLGLYVSLVGFILTVWAVLETRRSTGESQERVRKAIRDSEEETRRAIAAAQGEMQRRVQNLAQHLLRDNCEAVHRLAHAALNASTVGDWTHTLDRLQETTSALIRLRALEQLEPLEKDALNRCSEDLALVSTYIRTYKMKAGAVPGLSPDRRQPLERLLSESEAIVARLLRQAMET